MDPVRALPNIYGSLTPGGTLLLTVPCLARLEHGYRDADFFRWTPAGLARQLAACLPDALIHVEGRGNLIACLAYLLGLAAEELTPPELEHYDEDHPLLAVAVVRRAASVEFR